MIRSCLSCTRLAPTLLILLVACSTETPTVGPADEVGSTSEALAVTRCPNGLVTCVTPDSECSALCTGVCSEVTVAKRTCYCTGPCGWGLACLEGSCKVPPPSPPACTGPKPTYFTWWVPGAKYIYFDQLAPGQAPNPSSSCYSGCGPTAWAMFFAQIDSQNQSLAQSGQVPWWTSQPNWFSTATDASGSVLTNAPNYAQITVDISRYLGTTCLHPFAQDSYTEPSWMGSAANYINDGAKSQYFPRGPLGGYAPTGVTYHHTSHGTADSLIPDYDNLYGTLDYARDWIINYGYPVVYGYYVGAAVLENAHYGLATGYREKATAWDCQTVNGTRQWVVTQANHDDWQFFINGGGGDSDDWRSPAAYYVGTIKIPTH